MGRKTIISIFHVTDFEIAHKKTCKGLRRWTPLSETGYLPRAAQINAIKTNYNKAKIDNILRNSKGRLICGKYETINNIVKR